MARKVRGYDPDLKAQAQKWIAEGKMSKHDIAIYLGVSYDLILLWARCSKPKQKRRRKRDAGQEGSIHRWISDHQYDDDYETQPCKTPTSTLIGSKERIEVYRQRVERGEDIWHPCDMKDVINTVEKVDRRDELPGIKLIRMIPTLRKKLG